jgi:hypothetical protein
VPVGHISNFELILANDEDDWAKIRATVTNTWF